MKRRNSLTSQIITTLSLLMTTKRLVQAIGKPLLESESKAEAALRLTPEADPTIPQEKFIHTAKNWRDAGLVYLFVLLLTGFPLYVSRGTEATILAPLAGVAGWLLAGRVAGIKNRVSKIFLTLAWAIVGGLFVGLQFYAVEISGVVKWHSFIPSTVKLCAALGALVGLTFRLGPDLSKDDGSAKRNWRKGEVNFWKTAGIFGSLLGIVRLLDIIPTAYLFSESSFIQQARLAIVVFISTIIAGAVSAWVSLWLGWFSDKILEPVFATYERVWSYFAEIVRAITGYLLAYAVVIFVFAAQYWAAWILDAPRFYRLSATVNPPVLTFWDFIYFSLQTITTAGQGDVPPPKHLLVQVLISLELFAGIVITTFLVTALFVGIKKMKDESLKN